MTLEIDGNCFQIYDFNISSYAVSQHGYISHWSQVLPPTFEMNFSFKCAYGNLHLLLQPSSSMSFGPIFKKNIIIWDGPRKKLLHGCFVKEHSIDHNMVVEIDLSVDFWEEGVLTKNELRDKKLKRILGEI